MMQPSLQVGLYVQDSLCMVVGGNAVAEDRAERLLEARARVVVFAQQVTPTLARLANEGRIELEKRPLEISDLDECFMLLLIDVGKADIVELAERARIRGVQVYAHDRPDLSDWAMPAIARSGGLRLAISTSEESPALAGKLRADFERIFDEEFVAFMDWLGHLRAELRQSEPDLGERGARLRGAIEGFAIEGKLHYPEAFLRAVRGRREQK